MQDCRFKLSIIIPMYNAEKYIGACLDSLLNSGMPTNIYEIVVVNDGSNDKGPDIVKKYVNRFNNIQYLTQDNQGQSTARNQGIKKCHGEYIWCVDADDKLNDEVCRVMPKLEQYSNIDILAVQLMNSEEDSTPIQKSCTQPSVKHNMLLKGRDAIIQGYNPSSVCALIVRKQLIVTNNLFFHVGITHQDVELSYRLMAHAREVVFTDIVPYLYLTHIGSTSKAVDPRKIIKYVSDDCVIVESFRNLSKEYAETDPQMSFTIAERAKNIHFGMAYNLFKHRGQWKAQGINKGVLDRMRSMGLFPLPHNYSDWKKVLVSFLLNLSWFYE